MAAGIDTYSTTAASNTAINGIDIDENCLPSGINNAIRQLMADIRAAFNDIGAKAVSSGTNTVTLATQTGLTAYADGTLLAFIAGGTNTGAATLNVDSVGAKAIRKGADAALDSGDIQAGMLCIVAYDASANSAAGAWMLASISTANLLTAAAAAAAYQPLDADLTSIAALTTASYGRALLEVANQAALTALIGAATQSLTGAVEKATDAEVRAATADKFISADLVESASAAVTLTETGGAVAVDWDAFVNADLTVDENTVISNPTNGQPRTWRTILVQGNNTTDRTITFGNQFLGDVPTITDCDNGRWYLLTIMCITTSHFVVSSKKAKGT